jgi:cationic amino acid transporter 4
MFHTPHKKVMEVEINFCTCFVGLLVYFLYGIHHSKESDSMTSYSILMTSSEAGKGKWGSMHSTGTVPILSPSEEKAPPPMKPLKNISTDDKRPIVDEEELTL